MSSGLLGDLFGSSATCESCSAFLRSALPAWEQRLNWSFADRMLTPEKEADLRQFQLQLGLRDVDVAHLIPKLHRMKALSAVHAGYLPTIHPGTLMLPRGEVCHFASPSAFYQEVHQRTYVSRTTGQRSGRGYRGSLLRASETTSNQVHTGQWVQTASTVCVAQGTFAITSAAVRFLAQDVVTIPLEDILGFQHYPNAIELQYEGRGGKDYYTIHDGELAGSILWAARRKLDDQDE